jgi:hypothetical protein
MKARIPMEIMIVTFSGLLVLAIFVAILHWIDGRKPDGTNTRRKAPGMKKAKKISHKFCPSAYKETPRTRLLFQTS